MSEEYLLFVIKMYEEKLKQYMPEKEYVAFSEWVAKEGFKQEIEKLPEDDFKQFCVDNYDKIVGNIGRDGE